MSSYPRIPFRIDINFHIPNRVLHHFKPHNICFYTADESSFLTMSMQTHHLWGLHYTLLEAIIAYS